MGKFSAVSLFSGGGGLDMGFLRAGFEIVWAVDSDKSAVETYRANVGEHIVLGDINEIPLSALPKCDVVIGGPPCQAFSLAGSRRPGDARGGLVWKYLEIIGHLRPRAFLFENVPGLLSARNPQGGKVYPLLVRAFEELGYAVRSQVMDAAEHGVPQRRRRLFIVGATGGAFSSFSFPGPTHGERAGSGKRFVGARGALGDLPAPADSAGELLPYDREAESEYQAEMRAGSKGVTDHAKPTMSGLDEYIIRHVPPGGNYMDVPPDAPSARIRRLQREGGRTTCYGRLSPDKPSYTVNTHFNRPNVGCNIHYSENRLITVREALRLQSFPDSYIIAASSKQARNSIVGNAVPPKLAEALAGAVGEYLEREGRGMWLAHTDSEVEKYHPICERALIAALAKTGMDSEYAALRRESAGSLVMDYAVRNKRTGRCLCAIEVKRKPAAPPLKWAGGKRQLLAALRPLLPSDIPAYCEPFVGGGAMLFDLQPRAAYVNDANEGLIGIYRTVKSDVEALILALGEHRNEPDYFYAVRDWDRDAALYASLSDVQKAARLLYLNKTCYNGLFRVNASGQFNVPFGGYKNPDIVNAPALRAVSAYLNSADVALTACDYSEVLRDLPRGAFVYLDPPYDPVSGTASFTGYTTAGFGKQDQLALKERCDELHARGIKFMLSNSATDFIKDLYSGYNIALVQANRAVNSVGAKRGKVDEVVVRNYE